MIPFVDLKAQYNDIKEEVDSAIASVLESGCYVLGEHIERFEEEFASYCDARYGIAVNSGTSALHLALLAYGIGAGDEVITVPNTFIATAEAISYTGATPVFVDIDPQTYNIDVTRIEAAITSKTKAILPVHLFGQPADMDPILTVAQRHGLIVIEDACQSHGAEYKGRKTGSLGNAGCYSFYPSKVIGAYGEGGAIVCSDKDTYQKVMALREHGQGKKNFHQAIGYNYRMEAMQGAVLRVKLKHVDTWIEARRQKAAYYQQLLEHSQFILPFEPDYARSVYYVYVIRVRNREKAQEYLSQNNIQTAVHYPIPIHLQEAYAHLGLKEGSFPIAETYAREVLSLPMYPELSEEDIKHIINTLQGVPW